MISAGKDITAFNDPLSRVEVRHLYDAVRNPKPQVVARIRQLRAVRQLDPSQYAKAKRSLPYFTCALFSPSIRRTENFAYTECFVIDIDHISDNGMDIEALRAKLAADARVLLLFTSPSGDGLKVMFRLRERCYDPAVYKVFYRLFSRSLSLRHDLRQVVDSRTCDVTRACFISFDRAAYHNPDCEAVDLKEYIDKDGDISHALDLKRETEPEYDERASPQDDAGNRHEIDDMALGLIRKTLNPNARLPHAKPPAYVPEQLERIMPRLQTFVKEKGIETTDEININYGKKLRFRLGSKQAEVNIFYGKRGFSVVQSPRTGTDTGMNSLMADVIEAFLYETW